MRQWGTLQWESGPLGYPISDPHDTNIALTQYQEFQGGDNYYSPLFGGAVWGDIKTRYDSLGGSHHSLGVPISNEYSTGDQYRANNFSNGVISWKAPTRETRFMYLATQKVWQALKRENGFLGFPSADETARTPGVYHIVPFGDRGVIIWSNIFGARELVGNAFYYWSVQLHDDHLGPPLPSWVPNSDSTYQEFEKGILLATDNGVAEIVGIADPPYSSDIWTNSGRTGLNVGNRAATNSGTPATGAVGPILREKQWPGVPTDIHFIIRKGFYNSQRDEGWGWEKLQKKHNFTNPTMLYAIVQYGRLQYKDGTEKNNYKYTADVRFYDCTSFSLTFKDCKQVHPPVYATEIFRPVRNTTYKNCPSIDPNKPNDVWPVGVVTALCTANPSNRGLEYKSPPCPEYVNTTKRFGDLLP
ncbi:MAG: hypothetical protein E7B29_18550, partial [Mixta calida]|nr:hypothetical protein [Mixta calida]